MPENKIFPIVREKAPIVDKIRERMNPEESKSVSSKNELATIFRDGLAEGLNIPPEALKTEEIGSWIIDYLRAFVSPDLMTKAVPKLNEIKDLGVNLGSLIRSSFVVSDKTKDISTSSDKVRTKDGSKRSRDASVVTKN